MPGAGKGLGRQLWGGRQSGRLGEPGTKFCIPGITAEGGGEAGRLSDLKTERAGRDVRKDVKQAG